MAGIATIEPIDEGTPERREFFKRLIRFHKERGTEIPKMPVLGKREVDLHELYCRVKDRGGIREVIVERKWPEIVKLMPLPKTCTNAGFSLKLLYQKYLLDYERVFEYGLPDIPPAEGLRAGMPIPDYLPENVALPDPFVGDAGKKRKGRRPRDDAAGSAGGGGGGGGGDDDYDAGDDDEGGGGAAAKSRATPAVKAAVATPTTAAAGSVGDVARHELARALRRVELSLAVYDSDAEVDWALAVLLVQSQKKLPLFARDPTRRILDHLVALLERCAALMEDPLVGFLLNSQSVPGALRRQRITIVLLNGLAVDENRRLMVSHRRLFAAVLGCLHRVPVQQDNDMETRVNLCNILEALSESAKLQQPDLALALVAVVRATLLLPGHGNLRLVALAVLSKVGRDRDNFALLVPCFEAALVSTLVRMLGDALLQQSEAPGAENGLTALELCLDFFGSATADRGLSERLLARTGLVRLLVMFLLSALDASAPRMYLKLLRKAVTALQNLCQHEATRASMVPFFNDFLKISCSMSALAPDVVPLLAQLN